MSAPLAAQPARADDLTQGLPAQAARYPYVAAFSRAADDHRVYFCAGTLIAPEWIATAAHCFHTPDGRRIGIDGLWAEVGRDWLGDVPDEAQVRVARIVIHPDYDPDTQANDIALIRLAEIAGPLVAAVDRRGEGASQPGTALGFASFYEGELAGHATNLAGFLAAQLSDRLRRAGMRRLDPARCAALTPGGLGTGRLCGGAARGSACVGDSGGPLIVPSDTGDDRLIGIVSLGSGCAVADPVVVYTRVAAYADWIARTIAAP